MTEARAVGSRHRRWLHQGYALGYSDSTYGVRYSVIYSRIYKHDDVWNSTATFQNSDLLILAKVADMAFEWTNEHSAGRPSQVKVNSGEDVPRV